MNAPVYTESMHSHADLLLARSHLWTRGVRKRDGKRFFYIPGSKPGTVYMTAVDGCTCPAAQNSTTGDCKHQGAVRRVMQPEPIRPLVQRYAELYTQCAVDGCDLDPEPHEKYCHKHVLVDTY